jgi:hypothetical protein
MLVTVEIYECSGPRIILYVSFNVGRLPKRLTPLLCTNTTFNEFLTSYVQWFSQPVRTPAKNSCVPTNLSLSRKSQICHSTVRIGLGVDGVSISKHVFTKKLCM